MDPVNKFQIDIVKNTGLLIAIILIFAVILGQWDFCIGIILGGIVSIINFLLISKGTKTKVEQQNLKIGNFFIGYIVRFILMLIALWIASRFGLLSIIAAAIGLFMIRVGIYIFLFRQRRERILNSHG